MKNAVQDGNVLDITVAADVASGVGYLIGAIFGVTQKAGKSGEVVPIDTTGVFDLKYTVAATVAVGDVIYWDNTVKNVTKTVGSNPKIGYATEAAASAAATARVKLVASI
jgi:predicted RecA/RadA family phage recombinase